MRVLVTGGAGFIGSHLCEALLERGCEVWALDDLSTGRLENLRSFERHPQFRFLEGNVTDSALVHGLVAQCDRVFHLAAAVGVKYVLENPLRSLITNIRGTEVVLEACAEHGRKVMLFSSSEVYGKGVSVPFSEDDDRVMGPTHKLRWSYACGKAVDECLAQAYWQQRQLPVVTVRCFNTCGPAPDRLVRHGDPEHDRPRPAGRGDSRVRRRPAVALLLGRERRRPRRSAACRFA